jgi:hypothetical protein
METTKKDLKYYRKNAEEDYLTTPISVLRYISEMEQALRIHDVVGRSEQLVCPHCKGLEVYIDEYGGKPCKCAKQAN